MKKIKCIFIFLLTIFFAHAYADNLTCPSEDLIKSLELIEAKQHSFDPDCWNFISNNFEYDGHIWNIVFGSFFKAKNSDDALTQGRDYFKKSSLRNKNPTPVDVSNKIYCDYMSTGEEFWLSAVSPPETDPPSFSR